ncbi:MAG: ketoacyl-ACP synthase III [Bacteroidales bacterium]|nr:ketoacyl-ACP synthase III [Bacteroidales bacterium]
MNNNIYSVITGTGSYIPTKCVRNDDFLSNEFYGADGKKLEKTNREIIDKFLEITAITERRYVTDDLLTSDIAYFSAVNAIEDANIDKEELDYIIVAHNFGDVKKDNKYLDIVPSLAARVKYKLKIKNPNTVAYDLPFGCPGWLQAVIQADYYLKSGDAHKILVIGADILSRVSDPHDRDSMLYADGAGAVILEAKKSDTPIGILAHKTRSDTLLYSNMLYMGKSYNPDIKDNNNFFLKMNGRKLYQYALEKVPQAIKDSLDKCNINLSEIKKIFIHQANGKMDEAIVKRLYKLYDILKVPENIMPMSIALLGNSSVATIPTLLDLILKNKIKGHKIIKDDIIVFASVGAGMNINAMVYKM